VGPIPASFFSGIVVIGLPGATQVQTPEGFVRIYQTLTVVGPALEVGTFPMGSPESEPDREDDVGAVR